MSQAFDSINELFHLCRHDVLVITEFTINSHMLRPNN